MIGDIAHVYNRGFEKRKIFLDNADYRRFAECLHKLNNIKGSLRSEAKKYFLNPPKQDKLVEILKWCAMPNHYHLLLHEVSEGGIVEFTKRLGNSYTKYFNIRYRRSGYLFQNAAKIRHMVDNAQFLYIPYYIDLNPLDLFASEWRSKKLISIKPAISYIENFEWSSYHAYENDGVYKAIINTDKFFELFDTDKKRYNKELLKFLESPIPKLKNSHLPSTCRQRGRLTCSINLFYPD